MHRLFTFGCSFTRYWRWPTWADALAREHDLSENWGICGGGNAQILFNLMECHQRHGLTHRDRVLIMWTSTSREDRYVRDRWLEGGNIYWSAGSQLPESYVKRFACERGYLIRDMAIIAATHKILAGIGCDWRFFSMVPLTQSNSASDLGEDPQGGLDLSDVQALYRPVAETIRPSVWETVFGGTWFSGSGIPDSYDPSRRDFHPTPQEHLRYLDLVAPDLPVSSATRDWMLAWQERARSGDNSWDQQCRRPLQRL